MSEDGPKGCFNCGWEIDGFCNHPERFKTFEAKKCLANGYFNWKPKPTATNTDLHLYKKPKIEIVRDRGKEVRGVYKAFLKGVPTSELVKELTSRGSLLYTVHEEHQWLLQIHRQGIITYSEHLFKDSGLGKTSILIIEEGSQRTDTQNAVDAKKS